MRFRNGEIHRSVLRKILMGIAPIGASLSDKTIERADFVVVTRLDRLARSTRDLLNILGGLADKGAGFRSLSDAWADTTTPHGRLMLTVLN